MCAPSARGRAMPKRPEQEIAEFLAQQADDDVRIWARKIVMGIPSGTPDSELTELQRKAWQVLDMEAILDE